MSGGGTGSGGENGDECQMGGLTKFSPTGGTPSPARKKKNVMDTHVRSITVLGFLFNKLQDLGLLIALKLMLLNLPLICLNVLCTCTLHRIIVIQ